MKLVILDRDGVINEDSDDYIKSPDEWIPIEGSLEAIARLTQAGYTVVVATNQSGVARGLFSETMLTMIHEKMQHLVSSFGGKIDHVFYCPHGPNNSCVCRKPLPGLFNQIASYYHTTLIGVPAIGDSFRDIQAAMAVNAKPILVLTGKGYRTISNPNLTNNVITCQDLNSAVEFILK